MQSLKDLQIANFWKMIQLFYLTLHCINKQNLTRDFRVERLKRNEKYGAIMSPNGRKLVL